MSFRVWDSVEKKWLVEMLYIANNGDLLSSEQKMFGKEKTNLLSESRYIVHQDIQYLDKNDVLIYEGDICRIQTADGEKMCVVAYIPSFASYNLIEINFDDPIVYGFYEEVKELIEVVGNVCDNPVVQNYDESDVEESGEGQ